MHADLYKYHSLLFLLHPLNPAFIVSLQVFLLRTKTKKMADQSDLSSKTSQAVGHAQVKKDEMVDKASETFNQGKAQTGGFMQQTGEQVRQMAQGATDAVKNAVGMGGNSSSSITSNTTKP